MESTGARKYINIVLYEPEIPQNTGNIARLCACCNAKLFLIGKLGFSLSEKHLKRCGLDYWDKVEIEHILDFEEFEKRYDCSSYHLFTTKTNKLYTESEYKEGDFLIFGPETRGLPETLLKKYNKNCVTIPMADNTRSLNLSNSAAIGVYEVIRQFEGIKK